jgi:predicted nucleic acid-binding Zn ribbon protein
VRRLAPRPLALALGELTRRLEPSSELARVQAAWGQVVGEDIASHCEPVAVRAGVLRVACDEAVWASELELLAPDLLAGMAAREGLPPLTSLRASADLARDPKNA